MPIILVLLYFPNKAVTDLFHYIKLHQKLLINVCERETHGERDFCMISLGMYYKFGPNFLH